MIGQLFGNYKISAKLGAGGQGTVYKAVDQKLGRTVVLKVLPAELTVKEANLKRFEREAQLASALDHPNICTIFDMDEANGLHFIAMQYIDGKNVRQLCNGRPLELDSALRIGIQVTDALAAAHVRGIIHRDIKSGNVMVTEAGQVKILDFGLAKLLDEQQAVLSGIHQTELTEVGVPYGTATYAAPEQARGDKVDSRADIFSTGVLLYEMLTGTWPFRGKNTIDVRHAVIHDQPKSLADMRPGATPAKLQQILDRAMQKEPRDRYQRIDELRDDLRKVLQDVSSGTTMDVAAVPRHLGGPSPVSRAMRWLRKMSGGRETLTTSPQFTSHANWPAPCEKNSIKHPTLRCRWSPRRTSWASSVPDLIRTSCTPSAARSTETSCTSGSTNSNRTWRDCWFRVSRRESSTATYELFLRSHAKTDLLKQPRQL